jgi:hypothetical protein
MMAAPIFGLLLLVGLLNVSQNYAAPVIPNESLAVAEVLELTTTCSSTLNIQPPQTLTWMKLRLLRIQDVPPKANFLHDKAGEIIEVYSKELLSLKLVGKTITAHIVFRGDERSGLYWVIDVTAMESF